MMNSKSNVHAVLSLHAFFLGPAPFLFLSSLNQVRWPHDGQRLSARQSWYPSFIDC